jgi:hypothetical protein
VSHARARTIDGVQGGTWTQVHLLASPAVDRYRGYVGQSRSVAPTHTWNTVADLSDGDHGGRTVTPRSTPAEQIAAALARAQPKTFASPQDRCRTARVLRAEHAQHRKHLADRPPDVGDRLAEAAATVIRQERDLVDARDRLAYWQEQHDTTAGLRGATPARRRLHHTAARNISAMTPIVTRLQEGLDDARLLHDDLIRQQQAGGAFDYANHWRAGRIDHLRQQLDQHWTSAVVSAARDGHPHAYGQWHLRDACAQLKGQIRNPDNPDAAPAESGKLSTIGDPGRALQDLEQAVKLGADLPTLAAHTTPGSASIRPPEHTQGAPRRHADAARHPGSSGRGRGDVTLVVQSDPRQVSGVASTPAGLGCCRPYAGSTVPVDAIRAHRSSRCSRSRGPVGPRPAQGR